MIKKVIKYGPLYPAVNDFEMKHRSDVFMSYIKFDIFFTSSLMFIDFCRVYQKLHPNEIDLEVIILDKNNKEINKVKVNNEGRFEDMQNMPKEFDFYTDILAKLF